MVRRRRAVSIAILVSGLLGGGLVEERAWAQNAPPGNVVAQTVPMRTAWAKEVTPDNVLPEYPRPQLVRTNWVNLNGLWDFARTEFDQPKPNKFDRKILVPFAVESQLSGVTEAVLPEDAVWYRREFTAPKLAEGERLLVHFGAVDYQATVWVNGRKVGTHQGGFDPFGFDLTNSLSDSGPQEIVVQVTDPTTQGIQPRGKQVLEPGGIVYTAVSGIWQTVWLEKVPRSYLRRVDFTPRIAKGAVQVRPVIADLPTADTSPNLKLRVKITLPSGKVVRGTGGARETLEISLPEARVWSPDDPYLYQVEVELGALNPAGQWQAMDQVQSYFGLREVSVARDGRGFPRIHLNGQPLFNFGVLDQGYWPDGLYTAPTDAALKFDIELAKRYGFNMCRKHVKVEPARWYYWCDKLGLMVWQDMPSGDRSIGPFEPDFERTAESEQVYRHELQEMVESLRHHPAIVCWVPFNEGWGQFKTNEIIAWVKELDPTRLVDGPSGWADRGAGDLLDMHQYPGPAMFPAHAERVSVLGEYGGLGLPIPGHLWQENSNWGYRTYEQVDVLERAYLGMIDNLWLLKGQGLAAAVYTQITDVEGEVNGLATYDRAVLKLSPEKLAAAHRNLLTSTPRATVVLPASDKAEGEGQVWAYTFDQPAENWSREEFDDRAWKRGQAGFGSLNTPGAVLRTEWTTSDIWLRRSFELTPEQLERELYLYVHHDEEVELYLNGERVLELPDYTVDYVTIRLPESAQALLRPGRNSIALHCRHTVNGQYVDAGMLSIERENETSRDQTNGGTAP